MKKEIRSIWNLLAVICLIYYFVVLAVYHTQVNFMPFWLVAAAGFWLIGFLTTKGGTTIKVLIYALAAIGVLIFASTELFIIKDSVAKPAKEADYLILLGAKVKGTEPSLILSTRIRAAVTYLTENPETKIVVTGGQGDDEDLTEAQCMYNELVEAGIEKDRILKEEKAADTKQNLTYSLHLMDSKDSKAVVVTSDFHVYRAKKIAQKCGYQRVSTLSAKSPVLLVPNYYVREFFAVLKDNLKENI